MRVMVKFWRTTTLKALFGLVAVFALSGVAHAEDITVPLDESAVYVFDKDIATVAVANPSIANVSVHNRRIVLVQGRSFGTTNVVALDQSGHPIASKRVRVGSVGGSGNVTMIRGSLKGIVSYNCSPYCERVLVPGDESSTPGEFEKLQGHIGAKNGLAEAAAE